MFSKLFKKSEYKKKEKAPFPPMPDDEGKEVLADNAPSDPYKEDYNDLKRHSEKDDTELPAKGITIRILLENGKKKNV